MIARRSFLHGLVTLPMIGGGVTLIGNPTAAAVPVTDALHARYTEWLAVEYGNALIERDGREAPPSVRDFHIDYRRRWCEGNRTLNPDPASGRFRLLPFVPPSARAAVILSAAGVPLTGGTHV